MNDETRRVPGRPIPYGFAPCVLVALEGPFKGKYLEVFEDGDPKQQLFAAGRYFNTKDGPLPDGWEAYIGDIPDHLTTWLLPGVARTKGFYPFKQS